MKGGPTARRLVWRSGHGRAGSRCRRGPARWRPVTSGQVRRPNARALPLGRRPGGGPAAAGRWVVLRWGCQNTRERLSTVSVKQGAVRLQIAYVHATRELTLNGIPVDLPEGHDVVLVDDVDAAPVVVDTIRIGGSEPEWIETFLARSERVLDYIRCDLPLPEDAFGDERFRRGMQRTLDERCEMMGAK